MYNWSVDEKELKKYPEQYTIWRLEQMVNWGLGGEKLNEKELRKYWDKIYIIDPATRVYLEFLLCLFEDIDLFSEEEVHVPSVRAILLMYFLL